VKSEKWKVKSEKSYNLWGELPDWPIRGEGKWRTTSSKSNFSESLFRVDPGFDNGGSRCINLPGVSECRGKSWKMTCFSNDKGDSKGPLIFSLIPLNLNTRCGVSSGGPISVRPRPLWDEGSTNIFSSFLLLPTWPNDSLWIHHRSVVLPGRPTSLA